MISLISDEHLEILRDTETAAQKIAKAQMQ